MTLPAYKKDVSNIRIRCRENVFTEQLPTGVTGVHRQQGDLTSFFIF
jgi:hypothetical protein